MDIFTRREPQIPDQEDALPGRETPVDAGTHHFVTGAPLRGPWPQGSEVAVFANGCFWGTEELYWDLDGVLGTAVGYVGGFTPNPTYEEVCSGQTGHTEAAMVVFDPQRVSYEELLKIFWENHDPTQGMRQGNDIGTQYRSGIYPTTPQQQAVAVGSRGRYQCDLSANKAGSITTEIKEIDPQRDFYFAEQHHQQYLAKNPNGYRCHSATGIKYALGVAT